MGSNIVLTPGTAVLNITPFALASFSADLDDLALSTQNWHAIGTKYFLIGLSIELGIKAVLLEGNVPRDVVRGLGHNLTGLVTALDKHDPLILDANDKGSISSLTKYYDRDASKSDSKSLVYFGSLMKEQALKGFSGLPDFEALEIANTKLQNHTKANILSH